LTPIVTAETPASIPDIPETPLPSELSSQSLSEMFGEPVVNLSAESSPPEPVEVNLAEEDLELNLDWDSEPGDMGLDTLDSLPSGVIPLESMEDVLVEEALATESTTANLSELDSLVASWDEDAVSKLEPPEFEPSESLELLPVGEWSLANHPSSLDSYPTPPETPESESRSEFSEAEWSGEEQGELPEVYESATTNSASTNNVDVEQPHSSTSSNPTGRVSSLYVPKKIQITQFQPEPKVSDVYNKLRDIARVWHEHQSLLQEQVFE
jgi:hypothetical protein